MIGNLIFATDRGLVFHNASRARVQEMISGIQALQAKREKGFKYQFIITFDDGRRIFANDIWIAIGVDPRGF